MKGSILSILFIFIWTFTSIFMHLSFSLEKRNCKELSLEKIKLKKDVQIKNISTLDFKKIKWEELGKEFYYEGKLYDLVKIKNTLKGKTIYCINDNKEQGIINFFTNFQKENQNKQKSQKSFSPDFKFIWESSSLKNIIQYSFVELPFFLDKKIKNLSSFIIIPPPEN